MQEMFKGGFNQMKGKIKERWGMLTDDEIMQTQGNMDQLVGKIQAKYGGNKEDIRRELESMMR